MMYSYAPPPPPPIVVHAAPPTQAASGQHQHQPPAGTGPSDEETARLQDELRQSRVTLRDLERERDALQDRMAGAVRICPWVLYMDCLWVGGWVDGGNGW